DPFLALGFVAGVVIALAQIRKRESRFLLLWLGVMALPSVLTDFAPHFGREIGLPPVLALLVACGFAFVVEKARRINWLLITVYCSLATGLAFSTYSSVHDYFDVWGTRTGLFDSFDAGYLTLAQKLHEQPTNESVYLTPVDQNYYTIQFGLNGRDARSFDGRSVLVLPPSGTTAAYGIVTREDARSLPRLKQLFPAGSSLETIYDLLGKPYATIYRAAGAPQIAPQTRVNAQVGDAITLLGYDLARDAGAITLSVYWRSRAATSDDYTVFVHLLGPVNPATQSPVWAQDDARPGRASFPTPRWRAGEVVIDEYRLVVPPGIPSGNYQIEFGMYILETGARVRMIDANGAPMESNRVLLERIALP
ncbi:MAG TPA: hypothetical protein VF429_04145, partial [Anaerolineae bacterium]